MSKINRRTPQGSTDLGFNFPLNPYHNRIIAVGERVIKNKVLPIFFILLSFISFAQTEIYFKYDESGNQKYRGLDSSARQSSDQAQTVLAAPIDEQTFWKQVRLYPVPVNDVLTIDWTEEVDGLIESVSLYQHSTVHWKFQQLNMPNLNKQVKVNMAGYDWGVYIVRFTLKDGRAFSKNITKR